MSTSYLKALYTVAQKRNPELFLKLHAMDPEFSTTAPGAKGSFYRGLRFTLYQLALVNPAEFAHAVSHVSI